MRWSFWLFVLAEFCRRYETKGTWRGACSGVPSKVQGQSSWGGQGKPHEHVSPWGETGFIDFLKVLQCVPLGQAYSQVRHYGGRRGGGYPNIFSSVLRKSREWPGSEDSGGFKPPNPHGLATDVFAWMMDILNRNFEPLTFCCVLFVSSILVTCAES